MGRHLLRAVAHDVEGTGGLQQRRIGDSRIRISKKVEGRVGQDRTGQARRGGPTTGRAGRRRWVPPHANSIIKTRQSSPSARDDDDAIRPAISAPLFLFLLSCLSRTTPARIDVCLCIIANLECAVRPDMWRPDAWEHVQFMSCHAPRTHRTARAPHCETPAGKQACARAGVRACVFAGLRRGPTSPTFLCI